MAEPTRITVVDHRIGGRGRIFEARDCKIELDYQDDGRTLKVFVDDADLTAQHARLGCNNVKRR